MAANTFGNLFQFHSFGESHGPAMGVVIDGCPANVPVDEKLISFWCQRRKPGQIADSGNVLVSDRKEQDQTRILSGVFEQKTLGTPIAVIVENIDQRSKDYKRDLVRQGHADDVWQSKYGHRDFRGGGRSSGRETVSRVIAASFAEMFCLSQYEDIQITAYAKKIGPHDISETLLELNRDQVEKYPARFPDDAAVEETLLQAKQDGESFGGIVEVVLKNLPGGLGQPVFNKFKSELASAFMSIGAVVGVEIGNGFSASAQRGTQFHNADSSVYGGIRGGISTGEPVVCRVGFKPTSSVMDTAKSGRHDPCIVPRAVPVVEAMSWLVVADLLLAKRLDQALTRPQ